MSKGFSLNKTTAFLKKKTSGSPVRSLIPVKSKYLRCAEALLSSLGKATLAITVSTQAYAFNSEEHSNLVDMGVERFFEENPEYVYLLEKLDIQVKTEAGEQYRRDTIAAKVFATGDDSVAAYTGWQESTGESPASLIYRKNMSTDEKG